MPTRARVRPAVATTPPETLSSKVLLAYLEAAPEGPINEYYRVEKSKIFRVMVGRLDRYGARVSALAKVPYITAECPSYRESDEDKGTIRDITSNILELTMCATEPFSAATAHAEVDQASPPADIAAHLHVTIDDARQRQAKAQAALATLSKHDPLYDKIRATIVASHATWAKPSPLRDEARQLLRKAMLGYEAQTRSAAAACNTDLAAAWSKIAPRAGLKIPASMNIEYDLMAYLL